MIIHATRYTGKRNAPYRPQKSSPASQGDLAASDHPERRNASFARDSSLPGNGFSRHMNSAHLHQGSSM
ncbi:hypothetical protein EV126DRAFT_436610, partial [Verticillium dahliae]